MTLEELLAQRNSSRDNLYSLLEKEKQSIPNSIATSTNKINANKERFFSGAIDPAIQSVQGSLGISPSASPELKAMAQSKLGRSLSRTMGNRAKTMSNSNIGNTITNRFGDASNAYNAESSSRDYAFQNETLGRAQDFEAQQAEKDHESLLKRQSVNEQYGNLLAQIDPHDSGYSASDILLSQLLGLGTSIGTASILRKSNQQKKQPAYSGYGDYQYGE